MKPEGSLPYSQASATRQNLICAMLPLETLPPGDPNGGVVYLRIVLSPEKASCLWVFRNMSFLLCGVVSTKPNPQPGGPGYPFLSVSSPLTCLAWEALPVAYTTASLALGIMWPRKPRHYVKVGIPSGGNDNNNIPNLAFFKTACIYVLRVILIINSGYFTEQHLLSFISSEQGLGFLWVKKRRFNKRIIWSSFFEGLISTVN
jgi:hypothetical protein